MPEGDVVVEMFGEGRTDVGTHGAVAGPPDDGVLPAETDMFEGP